MWWHCNLCLAWMVLGCLIPRVLVAENADMEPLRRTLSKHCLECHAGQSADAALSLDRLLEQDLASGQPNWEKVERKLSTRQMPPTGSPRPSEDEYRAAVTSLAKQLDALAAAHPQPGRTAAFRRLTRTEYQHAVRDLLALDIDAAALLPPDESSQGFDNITVADLSPTLVSRYLTAAEKISRQAIGGADGALSGETFRVRPDITQDSHVEGLPLGTRGGLVIPHNFPADGTYSIQVHLMRNRNDEIESLRAPHQLVFLLDREQVAELTVAPPKKGVSDQTVDADLSARFTVTAGPHEVGVTFRQQSAALIETTRQPLNVHFNFYRHPRLGPAIFEASIVGPYEPTGPGETPSRQRILSVRPTSPENEPDAARANLSRLMRLAYRRPIDETDLQAILPFYEQGRQGGDFGTGMERALAAILVNPRFLFRIEASPVETPAGEVYRLSDIELASRLAFFLWSSLPDEELLAVAEQDQLSDPVILARQTRRMLADERSRALVTNFADQWLHLRNLESVTPDMRLFPDFDHNLREAFRRETELFVDNVFRADRSILELLQADYTFLNERLAKHYGIPHVHGGHFRRVELTPESHRGGLLRQGSILSVTSYATRTSPVLRGKWVLDNLLGTPPPPPPPNVPTLEDNQVNASLPLRERLAAHRDNAACAGCHALIDPVGFSLESFDAVGRWRTLDAGHPVDNSGGLPDGSEFHGVDGLETGLLQRPELFARALTEKLLTHALGRGVEYYDGPAVRRIVADAEMDEYRFSSLILGIVNSVPFQMRTAE